MCQQTRVDAADEKCSWDANQMFEGTSVAAAAGFWDVFVTECRLAVWLLLKAGLITSQMSCRIIRWCNRKKQTRKNDLVASDWWDEFWCHRWFLGSSLQLCFHFQETLHTTEPCGQNGCFSPEWKVLDLTELSLNSRHLHFGAACEYEIKVWNAKIFLKHLAFYLIPNFYMFWLIWSGNVLFFPLKSAPLLQSL